MDDEHHKLIEVLNHSKKKNIELPEEDRIEVVSHDDKFYCAICYFENAKTTILKKISDNSSFFNCPYCTEFRRYAPIIIEQ